MNKNASPNKPAQRAREDARAGQEFIAEVQQKMHKIVAEFATGKINRTQFHQMYARYQRQIMTVSQMIGESNPGQWRDAVDEGEDTMMVRKRYTAKAIGIAIYDNATRLPIETLGEFEVDATWIVPMLSSYQSAAMEIFRAGMRNTEMDNGQWLSFVPGRYTTLIVLFSLEPSDNQLDSIERMHRDFEEANRAALEGGRADPNALAYPFLSFIRRSMEDRQNDEDMAD
jgi:hypothetical protein